MPMDEYVVGFECDLSGVDDVAVQEAVQRFADHLRSDNEHNRPLQHLVDLLGRWSSRVTAAVAMDGEAGRYVATLERGAVRHDSRDRARFAKLREAGIVVVNPQADIAGDPILEGRTRQKLAAIDEAARARDAERLLRALAHPSNARGAKDAADIRRRIYTVLTLVGGPAAEQALIDALAREDNEVIDPVLDSFVRLPSLLRRLPDVLLTAWREKRELVARRILRLAEDLELSPVWLAEAPADLAAELRRKRPA